ncbi:MAG: pyridoxamine 5'-phosphate oxidase family protein [Hyphomicrobiaceae bacterium]
MVDVNKTRTEPVEQFWEMIDDVAAGMLGLEGSGQHMQPMHPLVDAQAGVIWFFARKDSDIAEAAGQGGRAHFAVVGRDHDYYACVGGTLSAERNRSAIDRFWGPVTAAWFDGKDDPSLVTLKLSLDDGVAWSSVGGAKFGWEIIKANTTGSDPDVGARQHFSFRSMESVGATGGEGSAPHTGG